MAKKTRTPPPPRRVQAPQRRDTRGRPAAAGSRRALFLGVGAAAAAAVVAVVAAFVLVNRSDDGSQSKMAAAAAMRAAGCTFRTFPGQGRNHLTSLTPPKKFKYNSFPPTSGPHYYIPAVWNFYTTPLAQVQQIHNLEHGGIVVQWGSNVPAATVDRLRAFWSESPYALLFAPLPQLGNKIAVEAWTHLATCTHFDERAFTAFRDEYRLKGPERGFTPENTQPGQ